MVRPVLLRARLSAEGDRPVLGIGAAHGLVFGGGRGKRFDHLCRIGSDDRRVDHRDDVDRFGCQILVVHPLLDRHRPSRQRIGIGKKCVGEQQIPFNRRQVRAALAQRGAVEQTRVETMVSGAQHRVPQQPAGFRRVPSPIPFDIRARYRSGAATNHGAAHRRL